MVLQHRSWPRRCAEEKAGVVDRSARTTHRNQLEVTRYQIRSRGGACCLGSPPIFFLFKIGMRAESCATAIVRGRAGLLDGRYPPMSRPLRHQSQLFCREHSASRIDHQPIVPLALSDSPAAQVARRSVTDLRAAARRLGPRTSLGKRVQPAAAKARVVPAAMHSPVPVPLVVSCSLLEPPCHKISGYRAIHRSRHPRPTGGYHRLVLICPADPDRARSEQRGAASARCSTPNEQQACQQ